MEIKCPKCGKSEFLIRVFVDFKIDPSVNFGNVKYDWIEKCMCANIACGYEFTPSESEIEESLFNITKSLLSAMKNETLILK